MRIAIDFDGVIFDKPSGKVIDGAKEKIAKWVQQGHEVSIFTNRPDYDYSTIKAVMDSNGIPFHRLICGKPSYDLFIDDRAVQFEGWEKEYL